MEITEMGVEWYLLCDEDMTAYELGKGGSLLADILHDGKRGTALEEAVRELESADRPWLVDHCTDPAAYVERVTREICDFMSKRGVRVDNDASWDEVWIDRGRGYRAWTEDARRDGFKVYKLVGSRYLRDDEYQRKKP